MLVINAYVTLSAKKHFLLCLKIKPKYFEKYGKETPDILFLLFYLTGTISYTIDQTALGYEYFGVKSNGEFYVKNSLSSFSSGSTLTITAAVTDTGGLQGQCQSVHAT